jgi:protein TonB
MSDAVFSWALAVSVGTHVAALAAGAALTLGRGPDPALPASVPIEIARAPEVTPAPPPPPVTKPDRRPAPPAPRPLPAPAVPDPEPVQPSALIEDTPAPRSPAPGRGAEPTMPANAMPTQRSSMPGGPPVTGLAAAGQLFSTGDFAVPRRGGSDAGGEGGPGAGQLAALGRGDGTAMQGVTSFARPLGGYQTTPRYPESARTAGIEGVCLLRFVVQADGLVSRIAVQQSAGHPDLDQAAVEAVSTWRFEPARRGKEPVAVWVTVPVRFALSRH